MTARKNSSNSSRAFTIMELLAVIAIIGVLSAILFPVFAKSKEGAYKAAALVQFGQLGKALIMYVDSSDGKYLPSSNYGLDANNRNRMWTAGLQTFVKDEKVFIAPGTSGMYTENWNTRGQMSIGYNSATAIDKAQGCGDVQDSTGCLAFKTVAEFDKAENPAAVALFALTPWGEVKDRYLGYEFSPYTGAPVPGLDVKFTPPNASDRDIVKEAPANLPAEMLKPVYAKYNSSGEGDGVTPIIFADGHTKAHSAKEILAGGQIVWRFR